MSTTANDIAASIIAKLFGKSEDEIRYRYNYPDQWIQELQDTIAAAIEGKNDFCQEEIQR